MRKRPFPHAGQHRLFWTGADSPQGRVAHRRTTLHEGKRLHYFCSMCGPKFCSMKITQDVRDYAVRQAEIETGMADKRAEFRERGGEVYLPADTARAADGEETVAAD